jgi:predicted nucleic-acid-binding Zn-ribbon protein
MLENKGDKMTKCIKCKKRETAEYESIGLGKFCQKCLDEENDNWAREAGFKE